MWLFLAGNQERCQKKGGCLAIRSDLVLEDEEDGKKTPFVALLSECLGRIKWVSCLPLISDTLECLLIL